MDHEVALRPCTIWDWLLSSSWDHFGLHQGKECKSDHGVWGPQEIYVKAYIIHWDSPMDFVMEEAKRRYGGQKTKTHDILILL